MAGTLQTNDMTTTKKFAFHNGDIIISLFYYSHTQSSHKISYERVLTDYLASPVDRYYALLFRNNLSKLKVKWKRQTLLPGPLSEYAFGLTVYALAVSVCVFNSI